MIGNGLAVWVVTLIFPARFMITADPLWFGFALVGIIFAFLNAFIKPIIKVFALPLVVLTFGLLLLVINAFILWLVTQLFASVLAPTGVSVYVYEGFLSYIIIGFTLGIMNMVMNWVFGK